MPGKKCVSISLVIDNENRGHSCLGSSVPKDDDAVVKVVGLQ